MTKNEPRPTFTKLKKLDKWGVRVPAEMDAETGQEIEVWKRDGSTTKVWLGRKVVGFDDADLFEVHQKGE